MLTYLYPNAIQTCSPKKGNVYALSRESLFPSSYLQHEPSVPVALNLIKEEGSQNSTHHNVIYSDDIRFNVSHIEGTFTEAK